MAGRLAAPLKQSWKEKRRQEALQAIRNQIMNGSLIIRYIDRGSDYVPITVPKQRKHEMPVAKRATESWAARTLREAMEQRPRLEDLLEQTHAELTAVQKVIEALESMADVEIEEELTTPPVEAPTPEPEPEPERKTVASSEVSDSLIIQTIKHLAEPTNGWISSGPVRRTLSIDDPNFGAKRLKPLVEQGLLKTKGLGARMQYKVVEQKPAPTPASPSPKEKDEEGKKSVHTPQHPGVEAMPEHLQGMPVASKNMAIHQRVEVAEGQLATYNDVQQHGNVVTPEVAKRLGIPTSRAKDYLDALLEAGLIKEASEWRRASGQTAGRTAKAFESLDYAPEPVEEEEPESPKEEVGLLEGTEGASVSSISEGKLPRLEDVRDAVARKPDTYSAGKLVNQHDDWDYDKTVQELDRLADMGVVERMEIVEGDPSTTVYNYSEALEPGAAALIDQARRAEEAATGGPGSMPVAGTSKQPLPPNKDVADTIRQVRKAGFTADPVSSGHWQIKDPETGRKLMISGTPSSRKTVESDRKRLNRMFGVHV